MKNCTLTKLNGYATKIAEVLLAYQKTSLLRKSPDDSKFTWFESVKKTISRGQGYFRYVCGIDLTNVVKTTQQHNYLANEILHKLRTHDFFSEENQKSVQTAKYEQMTFNI